MISIEAKKEAIELFGKEKVESVITMVDTIGEADAVYTAYEDEDDEDACEIINMLYFEINDLD